MCFSTYFKVQQIYFSIVYYSEENRNKTRGKTTFRRRETVKQDSIHRCLLEQNENR